MSAVMTKKPMVTDIFVEGARKGWAIGTHSILPNLLMAFVLIRMLSVSGLLTYFGTLCEPVMAIFGLPGESAMALMAAYMSIGGGVGVAVALFEEGAINGVHLTIIAPAIFIMGGQIAYMGRCLGAIGIGGRTLLVIMCIPPIIAVGSLLVMRVFVMGMTA